MLLLLFFLPFIDEFYWYLLRRGVYVGSTKGAGSLRRDIRYELYIMVTMYGIPSMLGSLFSDFYLWYEFASWNGIDAERGFRILPYLFERVLLSLDGKAGVPSCPCPPRMLSLRQSVSHSERKCSTDWRVNRHGLTHATLVFSTYVHCIRGCQ